MPLVHTLNILFRNIIPHSILINFILLIVLIYINWEYIKKFLIKINKRTWSVLVLIFIMALLIRAFVPSHQHIMYIDEPWYMEAGKDMLQTGSQGAYPKSIGWPFILGISFAVFGINNWVALYASTLLGALTVFTMFFMTFIITKRKDISLVSALLFSLFPAHIRWSASAETNVASLFFISLTIFFCFLYYQNKKGSLLWLSLIGLAFTSQFRPENYSLILLFILGIIIYDKKFFKRINLKFILPFLVLILLSFANLVQVLDFQTSVNWIESDTAGRQKGSNWSISNLFNNSLNYGIRLFNQEYQPIIISFLWIAGFLYMFQKRKRESLFLLVWLALYWIIYFTSWFQTLQGKDRLFMSFQMITAVFASYGMLLFSDLLSLNIKKHWIKRLILPLLTIITILFFVPYIASSAYKYSDDAPLLETKIPELAEKDIPSDCIIISNWPTILKSTTELNVIDIDLFLDNPNNQEIIFKSTECVLFFEDYCCLDWGTHGFREKCNRIREEFSLETFKSYQEGDKEYTFYKISRQTP